MQLDCWTGCYPSHWKGVIVPEAFQHPAKFSSRLIERIYQHAIDCGWLREGDHVVDPFGGVALGAFPALRMGLNWSGCELEQRFVDLGRANIDLWNSRYRGRLPRWGTAQIFQGDSRHLAQVIAQAQGVVSSPPYADSVNSAQSGIDWGKANRPDRLADSPNRHGVQGAGQEMHYGSTPGQLGAMPAGDSPGNIGNQQGETFWTAAREIVEQVYQVLAPGAHAIWVVKGYVKNRQYVDFPGQWRELCEAVGFTAVHEHRAMLVNHRGTYLTLNGEQVEDKTEAKSFFRRLAEKNGSPRIDWETVLCMTK